MAFDWRLSTWGDEVSLEYGKALRGYQEGKHGYRVFGSNGPIGWTEKPLAEGPGVILGRKGAYRGVHFSKDPFFVIDTAYYVEPKSEMDKRWLYYAIQYHKLGEIDDGSPIPSTTRAAVYVRELEVPSTPEQYEIGRVLASLDDRIEHNRDLTTNLEAIARRLFKSWFVDFDPVRAKAAGEKSAILADDIAALFPDRFVDSELGEIPEGWEAAPLSAVVNLDTTSVKPFDEPETEWTHFSIPAFDEGQFPAFETGEQIASNKYLVKSGSVLVSKLNPTQWRCWRPPSELVSETSICSTEFMQFVVPENQREFLWGLCESGPLRDLVLTTVDGTTGSRQRAKPKDVMRGLFVMPGGNLACEYSSVVRPLLSRADACILESRLLYQLRDMLLPRLISGKLRVADAETLIEEAIA